MFYLFVRFLCGINGRFFFKEVEVNGLENIPTDGGFLLALNHSNSFLDGVICAITNPVSLHYLTRSDVFAPPWEGILTSLHQVPVYRLRDGISKLAKNDETFAKCYRLINEDTGVLIFPEANTAKTYYLRPITKGASRLAINAQLNNEKPMYILPAGITYVDYNESGHKVFINYGEPIKVSDYLADYEDKPPLTINKLKKELSQRIKGQLAIPEEDEHYDRKVKIIQQYGDLCTFDELKKLINEHERVALTEQKPTRSLMHGLLSIPPWPVFYLIKTILSNFEDQQFILSVKFLVGMVSLPVYWTIIFCVAFYFTGFWISVSIVGLLVLSLLARAQFK